MPTISATATTREETSSKKRLPLVMISQDLDSGPKWLSRFLEGVKEMDADVLVMDSKKIDNQLEEADFLVVLNEDLQLLSKAWEAGVVPICVTMGEAMDYDPVMEKGNAFIATTSNEWGYFAALVRGMETYKFPYDWRHLTNNCRRMTS